MIPKINERLNLYGDNIAKVEQYDFSRANTSHASRVEAVTTIATICTQSAKAVCSESLYNKLAVEAHGIPSSGYEFVPVLIKLQFEDMTSKQVRYKFDQCFKFGQVIYDSEEQGYLLTNLRALISDVGDEAKDSYFNTDPNEIKLIADNFKVFKHKIDIRSARQFMRAKTANWQELSRRYVSGKKVPFEFYISDKLKPIKSLTTTQGVIKYTLAHYNAAIESGVKPQDARDILPQCTYTEVWSGWQPFALKAMLTERLSPGAQWEVKQTALAIKSMLED